MKRCIWYIRLIQISFIFAWYDIWIGAYWDKSKRWLYILPLPTIGIVFRFPKLQNRKCSTCRHEISSICLECDMDTKYGWEPKD